MRCFKVNGDVPKIFRESYGLEFMVFVETSYSCFYIFCPRKSDTEGVYKKIKRKDKKISHRELNGAVGHIKFFKTVYRHQKNVTELIFK